MMIENRLVIFLTIFSCLICCSNAIRGRRRGESVQLGGPSSEHRRAAHWGAVVKGDMVPLELSERIFEGDPVAKADPKTLKGARESKTSDDEEAQDARDIVSHVEEKPTKKEKGKKGKTSDESTEAADLVECDDPDDPLCIECDDPDNPLCQESESELTPAPAPATATAQSSEPVSVGGSVETSAETSATQTSRNSSPNKFTPLKNARHFGMGATFNSNGTLPQTPTTIQRSLTPFKLSFALSTKLYEGDLDDGDYAELSDSTELYLTQYFISYFVDEPTEFLEVQVVVQKTTDPLLARFYVSAYFAIPGNVPTMGNLFDRMHDAFSYKSTTNYISILNEMGQGNPFRNTISVTLINETPVTVKDSGSEGSDDASFTSDTPKFLSVIISSGVLVLVIVGLVWACRRNRESKGQSVNPKQLETNEGDDVSALKGLPSNSKNLGMDTNTIGYLQTIRNRYKDDGGSRTDREELSLDGGDDINDDDQTEATDNRQTLAELRDAINELDSFASPVQESYPGPPSVGEPCDEETQLKSQSTQSTVDRNEQKNNEYMDYLDLQASFEEEDLRT